MARATKIKDPETKDVQAQQVETEAPKPQTKKTAVDETLDDGIIALMKLYPQYERFYVTEKGFVHPENSPEYLRRGAKLYENKFYNK